MNKKCLKGEGKSIFERVTAFRMSLGDLLFSHGKTSSCRVLIGFNGSINYSAKKKLS